MNIIDALNWRYATKSMNGKKIPEEKIARILEAVRLAPTSSGLQPFEVLVITNQELKKKLVPIAMYQKQLVDSSHLLVFAAWDKFTKERIDMMFDLTNNIRGFKNEQWENYRYFLHDWYAQRDDESHFIHAAKQAYIGFTAAIFAAATEQIDSTPMEGFDAAAMDEILGLKEKGLRSVVILPLGYRDAATDWLVNLKKVRRSSDQIFKVIE
ncbi:NAD(P)H-dependent oxidoreductase [Citrobacter amalonaticus]|nr:NAD(P)H-dependent oxidoreductase [Citrobacter amalonaticus]